MLGYSGIDPTGRDELPGRAGMEESTMTTGAADDRDRGMASEPGQRALPPIPGTSWIVRILVPGGDIWRAEKRIRALEALPAIGDPITLADDTPGRVAGVCSPAMSGVHADIYTVPAIEP